MPIKETLNQPDCFVDIYPPDAGKYSYHSNGLLECVVNKDFSNDTGQFVIKIAPGGPLGINNPPYWSQILRTMSLVVIGMRRGGKQSIVMIGVLTSITDNREWKTGASTQRVTELRGADFAYYFTHFNYYSLWYLGATGIQIGSADQGIPSPLGAGIVQGDPGDIGESWFTQIMAGDKGILSKTIVRYGTAAVTFSAAMATVFENYDLKVPYGDFFTGEGRWIDKFREIFPFPYYEFFVTTAASITDISNNVSVDSSSSGKMFAMRDLGSNVVGTPTVVARLCPFPQLTTDGSITPTFTGIDTSLWEGLSLFTLEGIDTFITSEIVFDDSQVYNFYALNPTGASTLFGNSNTNIFPYIYQFAAAGDISSIQRYGFRPSFATFNWMYSQNSNAAANTNDPAAVSSVAAHLLGRYASYWEPTPLMAKAIVTTFLRPDIYPGSRFQYTPYKNGETWDFYVSGVTHYFRFGGESTTTLNLVRGLPTSIYGDNGPSGMLFNIHTGNAHVANGVYAAGTTNGGTPLKAISNGSFSDFLSKVAQVYVSPQGQ